MPTRTQRLSSATAIMRAAVGGGRRATGRAVAGVAQRQADRSGRRAADFERDAARGSTARTFAERSNARTARNSAQLERSVQRGSQRVANRARRFAR